MPDVTPDPVSIQLAVPVPQVTADYRVMPYSVTGRALYLFRNDGAGGDAGGEPLDAEDVASRALYAYRNDGAHGWPVGGETLGGDDVLARTLYAYVNVAHDRDPTDVLARALYVFEAYDATAIFPWIERITPVEQQPGGQVEVYGDGFGATVVAEGGILRHSQGAVPDPTVIGPGVALGIVSWSTRSPNLWPANGDGSGNPPPLTTPAIVGTLPPDAVSGMISVEETT